MLFMDDLKLYATNNDQLNSSINTEKDIRMSFELHRCVVLEMMKWKKVENTRIELPNGDSSIKEVGSIGYKYLGSYTWTRISLTRWNSRYERSIQRVKKLCRYKMYGGNSVPDINTWAVEFIRYGAGIIEWSKKSLANLDEMTRMIMTMNRLRTS